VSYLALLGWNHPTGKEKFADLDELIRDWDPSRLGASPATFDRDRLISLTPTTSGVCRWKNSAGALRSIPEGAAGHRVRELAAVEAVRGEMRTLTDATAFAEEDHGSVDPTPLSGSCPCQARRCSCTPSKNSRAASWKIWRSQSLG
jgi:glutamyl-tRNA synthetase/nondiscriminating glutamyl-tRNA synthetase